MSRMAQKDLKDVGRAADGVDKAKIRLRDAVHRANKAGESVRDIAEWARVSVGKVQKLLEEARRIEREGEKQ